MPNDWWWHPFFNNGMCSSRWKYRMDEEISLSSGKLPRDRAIQLRCLFTVCQLWTIQSVIWPIWASCAATDRHITGWIRKTGCMCIILNNQARDRSTSVDMSNEVPFVIQCEIEWVAIHTLNYNPPCWYVVPMISPVTKRHCEMTINLGFGNFLAPFVPKNWMDLWCVTVSSQTFSNQPLINSTPAVRSSCTNIPEIMRLNTHALQSCTVPCSWKNYRWSSICGALSFRKYKPSYYEKRYISYDGLLHCVVLWGCWSTSPQNAIEVARSARATYLSHFCRYVHNALQTAWLSKVRQP